MKNYVKVFLGAVILIGALIIAGCGNESGNQITEDDRVTRTEGDKDILTIGLDSEPQSLDPHRSSSSSDRQILQAVYSKLFDIDENLNIVPDLVEEYKVSDDGTVYTFNLRKNVTFHDGTQFNAEAVRVNFERMLDQDFGSPRKSEIELINHIEVLDELIIEITLSEPYAPFLSVLSDRAGMIISPTAIKENGEDLANHPVGTGPYEFVERVPQSHIKVTKFEDYWDEAAIIPNVVYKPITDENIRITNLTSGDLDMVNTIGFKDIEQLEANNKVNVSSLDGMGFQGIHLNMSREPFDNKEIREAINLGINRQALTEVVFHNAAVPGVSPFPPTSWAHNENMEIPEGDVELAKQLVKDSGVKNPGFTLKITPAETEKQTAQMIQSMLKEIGITVEIVMVEKAKLIEDEFSGNFDAVRLGWSGRADPNGNVYNYFVSDGVYNFTGINNSEIDQLLNQARVEVDQQARGEAYKRFSEILFEEAPYIFLYHEQDVKALKQNVKGFTHFPDGVIRPESIYFE